MTDPLAGLPPGFDAYKTLQVDPEADADVIQAAYRRLAQKFHPDVAGAGSAERMTAINMAWELLRDEERRATYDRSRASASTTTPDPASGAQPRAGSQATRPVSGWGPDAPVPREGAAHGGRGGGGHAARAAGPHPASGGGAGPSGIPDARSGDTVSPHRTSGRSSSGSGYDPTTMRRADGEGAAGPPPGSPHGSVLNFGRYAGWSLGEIARVDVEYLEWLDRAPIGRIHGDEIDVLLRRAGRRRPMHGTADDAGRGRSGR